jgi:Tfp pilus assembly PilM family ATPase
LDIGARATNLVISSPESTWFRSIGVSGENFTNALIRPLKLTHEQAEQLKRTPTRARRVYQIYQWLEPDFVHLVDEVERSLQAYQRQHPETPVAQLLGLGGGFRLHGLLRRLCRAS